jgi:hypothetical protein
VALSVCSFYRVSIRYLSGAVEIRDVWSRSEAIRLAAFAGSSPSVFSVRVTLEGRV